MKKIIGLITIFLILFAVKVYAVTGDLNYWIYQPSLLRPVSTLSSTFVGVGGLKINTSSYVNWGSTTGTNGYGLRDNAGNIQFKFSGGAWTDLSGAVAETDPIWSAFLLDPIFTNLTSTNFAFTNASGTTITSTNGYIGRLGVGGDYGTAYFKVNTTPAYVDAWQITDGTNYTMDAGFDSVYGGGFFGGLGGTGLSLWSNGGMLMRLTSGGKVGVGTASPTAKLSVSGDFDVSATTTLNATTTINGPLTFTTADGTTLTVTNLSVANLSGNPNITMASGYLYVSSIGGLYVQNTATFRSNVRNDTGASLTITGGTTGNTNFTGTISVVGTSTFATTSQGAFFQTGLSDCSLDSQTLNYNATTGNFSCLTDDTGGSSAEQRVMTSTANYFAFYTSSTAVTGTSWVQFSGGQLSISTSTNISAQLNFTNASGTMITSTNAVINTLTVKGDTIMENSLTVYGEAQFNSSIFGGSASIDTINTVDLGISNSLIVAGGGPFSFSGSLVEFFDGVSTTDLTVNGALSLPNNSITDAMVSGALTITSGSIDNTPIGATTPSTGVFTNLTTTNFSASNFSLTSLALSYLTSTYAYFSNVLFGYSQPNTSTSYTVSPYEPDVIATAATANTHATYSDDRTRMLVWGSAAGGSVSLKNGTLVPANTGANAFYNTGGSALQTITATSLGVAGSSFRGCITSCGFHYCAISSSTAATNPFIVKRITSSPDISIATPSNWNTTTCSNCFAATTAGLIGAVTPSCDIYMASSTSGSGVNKVTPFTVNTSTNTFTKGTDITITFTTNTTQCARVNNNGIYACYTAAPFLRRVDFTGTSNSDRCTRQYQAAPSATGPDLFALPYSIYFQATTGLLSKNICI